jgi:Cu2+-exporting ATPase
MAILANPIFEAQVTTAGGGISACPACVVAPSAERIAQHARGAAQMRGSCCRCRRRIAPCISTVEGRLQALPGVKSSRLNLTMKRVSVDAEAQVTAADLIAALKGVGYEAHELDAGLLSATETDRQGRDLLMRLGVAFFSHDERHAAVGRRLVGGRGCDARPVPLDFRRHRAADGGLCGPALLQVAWASLRAGRLGMDVPISLALILASSISLYETIHSGHHAYFDAAVMLAFFLLIGRYLDHRTRAIARSAAEELAALEVPRAIVLVDGAEVVKPDLRDAAGDLVLVRPGGRMPVDGVVVEAPPKSTAASLTGESLPVFAGPGTVVSAGEVNLTGPLTLRVTAAGKDSSLHRMADLVAVAEAAKTRYTSLAERAAQLVFAAGAYPVVQRLRLLDVEDRRRPALCDQHFGGGADHHLPLRPGPGGSGGGHHGQSASCSARAC